MSNDKAQVQLRPIQVNELCKFQLYSAVRMSQGKCANNVIRLIGKFSQILIFN